MLLDKEFYSPKPHSDPRKLEKFSKQSDSMKNMQQIKFQELTLFFYIAEAQIFEYGYLKCEIIKKSIHLFL
jgi:hypothetical protein